MIKKIISFALLFFILTNCVGNNISTFGQGVSIGFDPRTLGMQIDDTLMQKNLIARMALTEKKYFLFIQVEIIDGRIFLSGKVDEPEEKIKITKLAWETKGVRSVNNAIAIKGQSNFKSSAQDILITSQLRTALVFNKLVKSNNYTLETINQNIYIFGIASKDEEKKEVIEQAKKIKNMKQVIPVIYLVSELSRNKS
ncbi:MAG: BON domain-containing protein [Proteobacteria bacterium]|nr:BON domain-containing protein [Pseudomonadota bacterium]